MNNDLPSSEALLIIADSESSSDLYYATRFCVVSRVAYLEIEGRKTLLVNDLEYGLACSEARVDEVVSTSPYEKRLRAEGKNAGLTRILDLYLEERRLKGLTVPASFAFVQAEQLRKLGYTLRIRPDPFFAQRLVKSPEEIEAIASVQASTEEAMGLAADLLARSEIRGDVLYHDGTPLTSERVRREIQKFLLDKDCIALDTIVAGGDQGADPHMRGHGPLPAHETIIIDILPRSEATRYWGDMTRTFVRGKASPQVRKLYRDVLESQELGLSLLREGADGRDVHRAVAGLLEERGNPTGDVAGRKTGFIHATGHGVGLDIHELPRIGRSKAPLQAGNVVTIEPGLYYPGKGSVRIEDAAVVTRDGCRNLNKFPKELEL